MPLSQQKTSEGLVEGIFLGKGRTDMSEKDFDSLRPTHTDFMTSGELKKHRFTGLRRNSINLDMEIWIDGELRKSVSAIEMAYDPDTALTKAYEEAFLLDSEVRMEDPNVSAIIH